MKNTSELESPARIMRLSHQKGSLMMVIAGFTLAAIVSLYFAFVLFYVGSQNYISWSMIGSGILMILMTTLFIVCARAFALERRLNLFLIFLKDPKTVDFVEGTLDSYSFVPGSRRGKIVTEGKALAKNGRELLAIEEFAPHVWPFAIAEQDEQIQKGDDWYDLKGKRRYLPVPAYFICLKNNPSTATLVGIRAEIIEPALKVLKG